MNIMLRLEMAATGKLLRRRLREQFAHLPGTD